MDLHQVIAALKELALELGRTPLRDEFSKRYKFGKTACNKFGYTALIHAAELEPNLTIWKPTNEIFKADLVEVLNSYVPREQIEQPQYTSTVVLGDVHFPFEHQQTLDKAYKFIEKYKPKRVIQVGDLYDMYAHSKFPRSLNIYSPLQEETLAREKSEAMWKTIKALVPEAECVQLLGNHDVRPVKRTLEVQSAMEHVVKKHLEGLLAFEGVLTINDPRQEYIVEGIEFIHGYRTKLGDHRDYALMNAVCGHIHRGGVSYRRIRGQTLWELNAGFMADPESKALGYTSQKIADYTLGIGFIDEYGPRFIAF